MLRKMMIALAAITFVGAVVATNTADARGFGGGGFRAGGFRGGFGGGFRGAGVRSEFVGPGRFGFRPAFGLRFGFGPRFAFRNRVFFPQRRFAFAAVPLGVALGYGASCWSWQPTAWGWQRVCACGYGDGYGGWGRGGWGY
jgi:hypothetical protein